MRKQVKLDIDISDFFVLNDFQSEGKDIDILQLNFKSRKVLMVGELGNDMLAFCKNGGLNVINPQLFSNLNLKGILDLSNFVTIKKNYKFYLKLHNNNTYEIIGNEEDRLICPFIWSSFQKFLRGQIV